MSTSHLGEALSIRVSRIGLILASGIWAGSRAASSGDLWVALACGRYTLAHGITRNDPFSFNSIPGHWINQNWLSHVLLTWIQGAAGLPGLGIWKMLVSLAIVWLGADTAMALGAGPALATVAAIALGLSGRPFLDVRPNLHTVLLAAILIRWIVGIERRSLRNLWPAPALMILWANLHGGFLFGVIAVGGATAAMILGYLARGRRPAAWPWINALPFAALAAGLVSPYGIANLTHPWEISAGPAAKEWRGVEEWHPPFGPGALEDPQVRAFWIILGCGALLAIALALASLRRGYRATRGGREEGPENPSLIPCGVVALASLLLALTSRRFASLFAISTIPWLAATVSRASPIRSLRVPRLAWPVAAAAILLATGIEVGTRLFVANAFWPRSVGWATRLVRADEQPADAVRFLIGSRVGGRLFTNWTWGGYLIYADPFDGTSPRYRVYVDGRAQAAYPASASIDYVQVEEAAFGGRIEEVRSFLDRYQIDICVLDRRDMPLILAVTQFPEWVSVYGDDRAIVAVRAGTAAKLSGPFPDAAIARASEALRLRTSATGKLDQERAVRAFEAAAASCATRSTSLGITEMTRIARSAPEPVRPALCARAAAICDSLLSLPLGENGVPLWEALTLRANTTQCRAVLARGARDASLADRLGIEAISLADRADGIVPRYLR